MNVCMYVCIHAWMDGWIHEQAFLRQEFVPRCVDLDGHLRSTGNRASRFTCTHIVRFSVLPVLQHGFKCTRLAGSACGIIKGSMIDRGSQSHSRSCIRTVVMMVMVRSTKRPRPN